MRYIDSTRLVPSARWPTLHGWWSVSGALLRRLRGMRCRRLHARISLTFLAFRWQLKAARSMHLSFDDDRTWSICRQYFSYSASAAFLGDSVTLMHNSNNDDLITVDVVNCMGVDHGGTGDRSPRIWNRGTLMQIVPLRFCHIGTKRASCGLQNTPKSVFGQGARALPWKPLGDLPTLPQIP